MKINIPETSNKLEQIRGSKLRFKRDTSEAEQQRIAREACERAGIDPVWEDVDHGVDFHYHRLGRD